MSYDLRTRYCFFLEWGEVGGYFLSPGAMVDPIIGIPLMLAFYSPHARA